ncbi:MAG: asparagine synthase-related protein [Acidobacteriota bacterium]
MDAGLKCWVATVGSWFHVEGYHSGREDQLLNRLILVGPERLAAELEGFFVVVAKIPSEQELVVITDVAGSCHCFTRELRGLTAISSSSLLLAGLGTSSTLDPVGCQEFIATGIIYEDRTLYQEVRKMEPASIHLLGTDGRWIQRCYWRITDAEPESLRGTAAVHDLEDKLKEAVRKIGTSFSRPVCDLTGGYDSRAVAAGFLSAKVPFSTTVSGSRNSGDVVVSEAIARMLNIPHRVMNVRPSADLQTLRRVVTLTDGEYEMIEYSRVMETHLQLSEAFDVSVNGSYGELARGYWWELLFPYTGRVEPINSEKLARMRYAAAADDPGLFPLPMRLSWDRHFADIIDRANRGLGQVPNTTQMDNAYLRLRMHRWQGRIATSTNRIWPCISPFLFRSVLESVLRTSWRCRTRSLLIRRMLLNLDPRLANHPLEHGYPAVPLAWYNFHRFWPLVQFYGVKVFQKLVRPLWKLDGVQDRNQGEPARVNLWNNPEVREVLNPERMRTSQITDHGRLQEFLKSSRRPTFAFDKAWCRLFTIEYALRVLNDARMSEN